MGLIGSKGVRRRQPAPEGADPQDPMAACLAEAMQVARQKGRLGDLAFDKLLLKIPTVRSGFEEVHKAYHGASSLQPASPGGITGTSGPTGVELIRLSPSGQHLTQLRPLTSRKACEAATISPAEARQALGALGLASSQAQLDAAFAGLQAPHEQLELTLVDFLLALCVLLLRSGAEVAKADGGSPAAVDALQLALDSWCHFDKEGSGTLHRGAALSTLAEIDQPAHAPSSGRAPGGALQERWQQLDWDNDGRVGLREYLAALHSWVMEDAEAGGS